jgi:amidase
VQVVARAWREDVALAVAQHLEQALGGWQRPGAAHG